MWDCKTSNFSIFTFVHAKDLKFCTRSYYIRMEKLPKRWRHTSGDSKINLPINMTTTHLHNWGYLPPPLCPASRFSCATFTHSRSFDGQARCFIFMAVGFWTQYFMRCGLKIFILKNGHQSNLYCYTVKSRLQAPPPGYNSPAYSFPQNQIG